MKKRLLHQAAIRVKGRIGCGTPLLICYDQLLVVRDFPFPQQAGLLTHRSVYGIRLPNRSVASYDSALPIYSDEFVQDFHLFPFSPVRTNARDRHLQVFILCSCDF